MNEALPLYWILERVSYANGSGSIVWWFARPNDPDTEPGKPDHVNVFDDWDEAHAEALARTYRDWLKKEQPAWSGVATRQDAYKALFDLGVAITPEMLRKAVTLP